MSLAKNCQSKLFQKIPIFLLFTLINRNNSEKEESPAGRCFPKITKMADSIPARISAVFVDADSARMTRKHRHVHNGANTQLQMVYPIAASRNTGILRILMETFGKSHSDRDNIYYTGAQTGCQVRNRVHIPYPSFFRPPRRHAAKTAHGVCATGSLY